MTRNEGFLQPFGPGLRVVRSRSLKRILGCAMLVLALGSCSAASLEAAGAASATVGPGLVVYCEGVSADSARQLLLSSASQEQTPQLARPPMSANDDDFLTPLRRRLIPALTDRPGQNAGAGCADGPRFSELVDKAETALNFLDREQAGALLARAGSALVCGPEVASEASLLRFYFLAGALEVYLGKDYSALFENALSIDPFMNLDKGYPEQVRTAVVAAREHLGKAARVQVDFGRTDLAGLTVRVDGVDVTGTTSRLLAGEHALQLVDTDGQAIAGARVMLAAGSPDTLETWPPESLRPPEKDATLERLRRNILALELDEEIAGAMDELLARGGYNWLLLVASSGDGQTPSALWVFPNQRYEIAAKPGGSVEPAVGHEPRNGPSRWQVATTTGLGAATLFCAATYGYTLRYHPDLGGRVVPDVETQKRMYYLSGFGLGGTIVGGVATAISASLTWRVPRGLYAGEEGRARRTDFRLVFVPGIGRIDVLGRF